MNMYLLSVRSTVAERFSAFWRYWVVAVCLTPGLAGVVDAQMTQMPPARVIVAKVEQRQLNTGQTFVGTVVPLRTSTVASAVEGLVDELAVREGDEVKQGETLLAKLRDRQFRIQEAAASAELQARISEHAALVKSLPSEIDQAHARMKAAEAVKILTGGRLKRSRGLIKRKAISEDDLEAVESAALWVNEDYCTSKGQ